MFIGEIPSKDNAFVAAAASIPDTIPAATLFTKDVAAAALAAATMAATIALGLDPEGAPTFPPST
ncbi:hypothetical protein [Pyrococcus furiosus]|uniref:hypothetical protein n=1 Tax=Pyrococcus furiosus TaxID=2261 RepID=UPI00001B572D|nr:hypothetical protein [Pyrococcus furiosus]